MTFRFRGTSFQISQSNFAGIAVICMLAILSPWSGSIPWDFEAAYRHDTLNQTYGNVTWNPYPAYWLITPFALMPSPFGFLLWGLVSAIGFIVAIKQNKGSYLAFSLSLPCVWIFFAGQIEGFMALGLVMAMHSSVWTAGIGLTLLTLKPQVGLGAIMFVILRRHNWRLLVIPLLIYTLSVAQWGWWVPTWLESTRNMLQRHPEALSPLFPYGLVFLLVPLLNRSSLRSWLASAAVAAPYFAPYSLALLFCTGVPLWASVWLWALIAIGVIATGWMPPLAFVVPLGILIGETLRWLRAPRPAAIA